MAFLGVLFLVILMVAAVLLVLVILLQDEEGEGIGGLFGGGSTTAFGSRSGNILTRVTAILATVFIVCTFALAWINRSPSKDNVIGKARQQTINETGDTSWYAPLVAKPDSPTTTPVNGAPATPEAGGSN
jgi:preprotein translocase subunit SecG